MFYLPVVLIKNAGSAPVSICAFLGTTYREIELLLSEPPCITIK